MDYKETLEYISSVNWKGSVPGLERISILLKRIEDPQKDLRFIHIGGTNGKGSTSAFISYILKAAGFKTGLFISPYIEVFNERMQINNQNISDEELAEIATYIRPYAETMEDLPTEFELNTAIAFEYFKRNRCDIVVLEVGMGGEFDATNVIDAPMAAVLTSIGLDHTAFLGDTVEKIAATKSGIIKEGCQVILYQQDSAVTDVIKERCRIMNACLHISEPEKLTLLSSDINGQLFDSPHGELYINLPAAYQKNNLATALKTIEVLNGSGLSISDEDIRHGLKNAVWPGRFERIGTGPDFFLDGAHNPPAAKRLKESLNIYFTGRKIVYIMGVLADKSFDEVAQIMFGKGDIVYTVTSKSPRALPGEELAKVLQKQGVKATFCSTSEEAIMHAADEAGVNGVVLAFGTLSHLGELRKAYEKIYG